MAGGKTENVVPLPKKLASAATPVDPDDSQIDCCTLLRLGAPVGPWPKLRTRLCGLRKVMAELPLPLRKRGGSVLDEYWLGFACYLGVRTARRRSAGRACAKMGGQMADFSCLSTKRSSDYSPSMSWKPPRRFRVIVAVAALALAGCNANQTLNPSGQAELRKVYYPNYNPYDPTKYGQTSGVYVSSS